MERQIFNGLLAIAAVSADSGLLVINRFTLSCEPFLLLSKSAFAHNPRHISWHIQVSIHFRINTPGDRVKLTLLL